jgi:hypothetical protein
MVSNNHKHFGTGVQLSPFALLRVAGLPLRQLRSLATPESSNLAASVVAARALLELLRPQVEEDLHAIVPCLADGVLRSAAIQLRRDAHSARMPRVRCEHLTKILELLPHGAKATLQAWLKTRDEIAEQLQFGQLKLDHEIHANLRPGLWSALGDRRLSLGIALASPALRYRLDVERNRSAPSSIPTKCEVGLLRYLLRAVCKTSPFSTFMDVGTVAVSDSGKDDFPCLVGARVATNLRVNRGIVARLYNATLLAIAEKDDIQFRPNPTIRNDSHGGVVALAAEQVALLGRPWRQERPARFRIHEEVTNILLTLPTRFSMSWLVHELTRVGLTSEHATKFVSKLIERELILPPAVCDAFASDPLGEISKCLKGSSAPEAHAVAVSVEALRRWTDSARHADWEQRIKMDRQIREIERGCLELLRFGPRESYRNVFFEESRLEGIAGRVSGKLRDLIRELGGFLRDQVVLRPEYVRLRDAFLERYGASGTCTDVVRFLSEQVVNPANVSEIGTLAKPLLDPGPEVPAKEGMRIGLTAFVQIAGNPTNGAGCDDLIVVNRVYEGLGWLSARYSEGTGPEQSNFRDALRLWLESTSAPAEPIDLPLSGHCNDLQAHPQLTRRILAWPGEPIRADHAEVLSVRDITLCLNAATGMLELLDPNGRIVLPIYLGSVLPVPTWGPVFSLTVLAAPMQLLRPSMAAPGKENSDVTFYPRRMHGRIVLTRASWSVRTSYLKKCLGTPGFYRLVNMAERCDADGIPRVFFARAQQWRDPLRGDSPINARKPTFIDTSNPFCLDLLDRLARDVDNVELTEVLPTHQQGWAMTDGDYHVAEIQIEMCVSVSG